MKHAILIAAALWCAAVQAKTEDEYNRPWCESMDGGAEFILLDRTRVDCMTNTHAWETDFARKWYEGVGQALHYARMTGLRAGLALIVVSDKDFKYVTAALLTIGHHRLPIDVKVIR